jgi:hypothetical protein
MRRIILATALMALSPLAYAQSIPGGSAAPGAGYTGAPPPPSPSSQMTGQMAGQPDPNNCGTPDEPKPCPPMPRHPLPDYPPNRQ